MAPRRRTRAKQPRNSQNTCLSLRKVCPNSFGGMIAVVVPFSPAKPFHLLNTSAPTEVTARVAMAK